LYSKWFSDFPEWTELNDSAPFDENPDGDLSSQAAIGDEEPADLDSANTTNSDEQEGSTLMITQDVILTDVINDRCKVCFCSH